MRFLLCFRRRSLFTIQNEKLFKSSIKNDQNRSEFRYSSNFIRCPEYVNKSNKVNSLFANNLSFSKKQYYLKLYKNIDTKFERSYCDQKNREDESNLSFKDFQNVIDISQKGDPDLGNFRKLPMTGEHMNIDIEIEKALKILAERDDINYKDKTKHTRIINNVMRQLPEYSNLWISVSILLSINSLTSYLVLIIHLLFNHNAE